jgi:hypothetical protein
MYCAGRWVNDTEVEMTETARGIGYIDNGRQVFEGFSILLNGNNGWIELVPTGLAYAELGYDPGNIVGMKVVLGADSFRGERIVDLPLPTIQKLQTDLHTWDREGELGFTFPSPSISVFIPPAVCECIVEHPPWSRRDWQVHCRLSNFEDSSDPNTGHAANMEVYFMLNVASVDSARRDLSDFLRYVSSMTK